MDEYDLKDLDPGEERTLLVGSLRDLLLEVTELDVRIWPYRKAITQECDALLGEHACVRVLAISGDQRDTNRVDQHLDDRSRGLEFVVCMATGDSGRCSSAIMAPRLLASRWLPRTDRRLTVAAASPTLPASAMRALSSDRRPCPLRRLMIGGFRRRRILNRIPFGGRALVLPCNDQRRQLHSQTTVLDRTTGDRPMRSRELTICGTN